MADPRFHTVAAFDGAELHVQEDGAPDAPVTLVLAHGWTLSARAWRAQAEALAAGGDVRVLRYDQRGHGASTRGDAWLSGVAGADAEFSARARPSTSSARTSPRSWSSWSRPGPWCSPGTRWAA